MSKALKIGITGGIGSGKSVVCEMFSVLGVPIYNADFRAKYLMKYDATLVEAIKKAFGEKAYSGEGELDRQYLAERVFHDQKKLRQLNSLVHPQVAEDYDRWHSSHSEKPYTLKEAALMIESGAYLSMDKIITVSAPVDLRLERVLKRDPQRGRSQVEAIMSQQLDEKERSEKSDYILKNDETCLLSVQVLHLHEVFLKMSVSV